MTDSMTAAAIGLLNAAGVRVTVRDERTAELDDLLHHIVERRASPSPRVVRDCLTRLGDDGAVLYIVESVGSGLRDKASRDPRVGYVSLSDRTGVIDGHGLDLDPQAESRPVRRPHGKAPWGRFALLRALARTGAPRTQKDFARECNLTQSGVSLLLRDDRLPVDRVPGGWVAADRAAAWDRFIADYPGPRGIRTSWYGLDSIVEQAKMVVGATDGIRSGDTAADLLAPWRVPGHAVVYSRTGADLGRIGFAAASEADATCDLVVPADPTIFATASPWGVGGCADPAIAAWDVSRTGGPDSDESIAVLRAFVLADRPA